MARRSADANSSSKAPSALEKAPELLLSGSIVGAGGMAGGVAGGGTGAAIGMVIAGPPGAAVGFLIGLVSGTVGGGAGTGFALKKLKKAMREEE